MDPRKLNPFLRHGRSFEKALAEYLKPPKPVDVRLHELLPPAIYQFKIQIRTLAPAVWRRVQVPNDLTLHQLHRVIQILFGWWDYHLHHFEIQGTRYGIPDPEMRDIINDRRRRLRDFTARAGTKWRYEYDYGDSWFHVLTLERILPPREGFVPECLKGVRAGPKEDSGGPWGYVEKLRIMRDPTHPEHTDICDWMGRDLDPERFDLNLTNVALQREFARHQRKRKKD